MNKKALFLTPIAALGLGMVGAAGSYADEGKIINNITTGDELHSCIEDTEAVKCVLATDVELTRKSGWDADNTIEVKDGHKVDIDLNSHNISTAIRFTIENGTLTFSGAGKVVASVSASQHALFEVRGTKTETTEDLTGYSTLTINKDIEINSNRSPIISIPDGGDAGWGKKYSLMGQLVNVFGKVSGSDKAIVINSANIEYKNAPTVYIGEGAKLGATDAAITSETFSNVKVEGAEIEAGNFAFRGSNGKFEVYSGKITAENEGGSIFKIDEKEQTKDMEIDVVDGDFTSLKGSFYNEAEPVSGAKKTVKNIKVSGGIIKAKDIFRITPQFNHSGFITGGTWGNWDESENGYVSSEYLKDFEYRDDLTIMTVTKPVVENLPEGYKLFLSRYGLTEDDVNVGLAGLLKKIGFDGQTLPERLELNVLDAEGNPVTDLGDQGVNIKIETNFPEVEEGYTRNYYVISCHESTDEFCTDDGKAYITGVSYENGILSINNIKLFSDFYVAYKDTKNVVPEEEKGSATTPDTGANSVSGATGEVAKTSAIALFALAGAAITTFIGTKIYSKIKK